MNKFKVISVVGARPQFIKAAAISRAFKHLFDESVVEVIVHTGQHYDENMSGIFFRELGIPEPSYDLSVGSGNHSYQTGNMMQGIEKVLLEEKPQAVIVYGDTNSTLAGALAAAKLHIPVVHVEAGLRSFNKSMPEEINRIASDHVSTLLFTPTLTGIANLEKEGFKAGLTPPFSIDRPGVFHCGDVMFDNALYYTQGSLNKSEILAKLGVAANEFMLCTIHRENNTDDIQRLNKILDILNSASREYALSIVLPLHPRTAKIIASSLDTGLRSSLEGNPLIRMIAPVSYLEMLELESNCRMVVTDSGGVQKEAYFFRKPSLVLRAETEWKELPVTGASAIVDVDEDLFRSSIDRYLHFPPKNYPDIFGDGRAADFIVSEIVKFLSGTLVK